MQVFKAARKPIDMNDFSPARSGSHIFMIELWDPDLAGEKRIHLMSVIL